jgi:hypothetical protein
MKIKVGDRVYDGSDIPIMVILTDQDKNNIARMPEWATKYAQYPDTLTEEEVSRWMGANEILKVNNGE